MGEWTLLFSLQTALFLLCHAMRTIMGMFSFAFWVTITQKCEVVIFCSQQLAHIHARSISKLWHVKIAFILVSSQKVYSFIMKQFVSNGFEEGLPTWEKIVAKARMN